MTATSGNVGETRLLTTAELCERLRLSDRTVRRMLAAGEIASSKVGRGRWGGRYRVTEEALADYMARQTVEPQTEPAA